MRAHSSNQQQLAAKTVFIIPADSPWNNRHGQMCHAITDNATGARLLSGSDDTPLLHPQATGCGGGRRFHDA
jgi:hypothetical protein